MQDSKLDAEQANVSVSFVAKKKNIFVRIDRRHAHHIFLNLVDNAIKFCRDGGSVRIRIEEKGAGVVVIVQDDGIGIPEKDQANVFSKFFGATNASQLDVSGTGLGLYVVKSYVEFWKGKIWFESTEGKGTTFFVRLPKKK